MKTTTKGMLAVGICGLLLAGSWTMAAAKGSAKSEYLLVVPHTAETCLSSLDELAAAKSLDQYEFGCLAGDHTGYAHVEAESEAAALATVPEAQRANAKAIKVSKFTAAQVRSLHQK